MADPLYSRHRTRDGVDRTTSSWTDHRGVHHKVEVETANYTVPHFFSSTVEQQTPFRAQIFTTPAQLSARVRQPEFGSGDLGAAYDLLEHLVAERNRSFDDFVQRNTAGSRETWASDAESSDTSGFGFDDSSSGESLDNNRRRFPQQKESTREKVRSQHERQPRQEASSNRHLKSHRRQRSIEHKKAEATRAKSRSASAEHSPARRSRTNRSEPRHRDKTSKKASVSMMEAVEVAVDSEQRSVRRCKQQLERCIRQDTTSVRSIQLLVDKLKLHEESLKKATDELNELKSRQRDERKHQARGQPEVAKENPGESISQSSFKTSSRRYPSSDPFVRASERFDNQQFFGSTFSASTLNDFFNLGAKPLFNESFFSSFSRPEINDARNRKGPTDGRGSGFRYAPKPSRYPETPSYSPPTTQLTPDEAKQLYEDYNQRWNALTPTDGNIPFPARGFLPASLTNRNSIWAPHLGSDISTWSDEAVMQANAQAFFLGAVGLKPKYSQSMRNGKAEMGFDRKFASSVQLKELIDMLKKEKTRWHSDRLGRRNDNTGGTNEALQKDERARAVFHAVCELMEIAQ